MALRLHEWKRRLLGISAGVLLCASLGCQNTREERRPLLNQGGRPLGPGNTTAAQATPATSPVFNNLAGNGPMNAPSNGGNAANVAQPIGNPGMTANRVNPAMPMQNVQPPMNNQAVNPAMYGPQPVQPVYGPNGQMMAPNYGQPQNYPVNNMPQQGYPTNNVPQQGGYPGNYVPQQQFAPNGYPVNQQNFPAPQMPTQNMQGMPQQQMMQGQPLMNHPAPQQMVPGPLNAPPLSSNGKMNGIQVPEQLPASVTGEERQTGPSLIIPASGMELPSAPGEPPTTAKVLYESGGKKPAEVKSSVPPPLNEEVVPAPVTHSTTAPVTPLR